MAAPLYPCLICSSLIFWRSSLDGRVYCAVGRPPSHHTIIRERLRAVAMADTQLRGAMRLILHAFNGAERVDANAVVAAAGREKISVATLTRAREKLGIRSMRESTHWVWACQ